ncbi:hypothetical protein ZWY2020_032443 [Hordeum vulgare]|nr:hypothetical protein ZWY2020_032443 [Hordeum vulgare]
MKVVTVVLLPLLPLRRDQQLEGISRSPFPPLDRLPRHCFVFFPEAHLLRRAPPLRALLPSTSSTGASSSTGSGTPKTGDPDGTQLAWQYDEETDRLYVNYPED